MLGVFNKDMFLTCTRTAVKESKTILAFEKSTDEYGRAWDRFLTVEGKRAYYIGNVCDTCQFLFERLEGANQKVSPQEVSESLRQGISFIDDHLLQKAKMLLPQGDYLITLSRVNPHKVSLGSDSDYFTNEQIDLWGVDGFWGLPHYPKVGYYRSQTKKIDNKGIFEFIIPMYPENWLSADTIKQYENWIDEGRQPTALAISVLDVKQPADWEEEKVITEHWCLSHYLIDGHHKMFAASLKRQPITLLSFLAIQESVATEEQIEKLNELL